MGGGNFHGSLLGIEGQGRGEGCYEDLPSLCVKRTSEVVQSIGEAFVLINWSFGSSESAGDCSMDIEVSSDVTPPHRYLINSLPRPLMVPYWQLSSLIVTFNLCL